MKKIIYLFFFVSICLSASNSLATTYTWTGNANDGGLWTTPNNWDQKSHYPGYSSFDVVSITGAYTISLNANIALSSLNMNNANTVTINTKGFSLSASSGLIVGNNNGGVLNILGSGAVSIGAVLTLNNSAVLNLGSTSDHTTNFTFSSGIATLNNNSTVAINNYGAVTLTSVAMNFGNPAQFNTYTGGTVTATSVNFNFNGGNSTITNAGTFTAISTNFYLSVNPNTITNTGTFNATSANFYLQSGNATINNAGTFNATSATFTLSVNPASIVNTGNFNANVCQFTLSASSNGTISNYGTFTVGTSTFTLSGNDSRITNYGTFNAGTYSTPVYFVLNGTRATILNTNNGTTSSGNFTLGSSSVIYPTATTYNSGAGNNSLIKNDAACSACVFTLISDANSTASIEGMPTNNNNLASGSGAVGNFNIQRYFKAGAAATTRNYRSLSSAVNNGSGGYNLTYLNAKSGSLTGVFTAGPGTNTGFTVTNATPTIDIYQENVAFNKTSFNAGNFKGLTNITGNTLSYYTNSTGTVATTTLPVGNGFLLYYCGDNIDNVSSTSALNKQFRVGGAYIAPDDAVTTQIGALNQGPVSVKLWYNNSTTLTKVNTGYTLVGNPYASSIDWDTYSTSSSTAGIYAPNVSSTIYVFNYSSKNYGYYQSGTSGGLGTNNATHIIASGQGFFIQATAATGASLTFNEAAKTVTQSNTVGTGSSSYLMLNSAPQTAAKQLLRIKLARDTVNTDDIMLLFEPTASNKFEPYVDVVRIDGMSNVSTLGSYSSDSLSMLGINHLHSIDSTTRIKLYVNVSSSTTTDTDTLSGAGFESLDNRYTVWLLDHYKKDSLQFSLYKKYLFNINNADTASYGANRFEIVFRKQSALIYRLLSFTGTPLKGNIQLNWTTSGEGDSSRFELQRLNSSGQFITINQQQANGSGAYNYLDIAPLAGSNSYRLQQTDSYRTVTYSNVITITNSGVASSSTQPVLSLYPNPVVNQFTININQNTPANVILRITDALGQTLVNRITVSSAIQQNVANFLPGSYVVQLIDSSNQNIVGQTKFIKK